MAPNSPSLLEYARFYNVAEDSTRYCPLNYADDTCEPKTPIPPVEGLGPEHPGERLKEIDRQFCTDLMMEKLETQPGDMEVLSGCLQLDSLERNIWRGILPEVTTSDSKGETFLLTAEDERIVTSSEFHSTFAQSPAPSSPAPSVRLVVPSGPDVPVVPINTRDVFEQYNSGMSQSTSGDGSTTPGNIPVQFSNIPTTSHLAGDAFYPIVDESGTVHQFVSIESDHDPDPTSSFQDLEAEAYAPTALASEVSTQQIFIDTRLANQDKRATESEFSAFDFDNAPFTPPFFDVSPHTKSQPNFPIVSPHLTKEKGFSVGRADCQEAQARRDLKGKKGRKALLEPMGDTGTPGEQKKGIVTTSISTLHEGMFVTKGCSNSSITRPENDRDITQLARDPQNENDNHVTIKTPYEQNLNTMTTQPSSSMDKRDSCIAQQELFGAKLGYNSHYAGLIMNHSKPPHTFASIDCTETPKSSKAVSGGLGSLSLFMQTRGSDGGYVSSSHDPSSLSLSESTRSGQGEFSDVPSLVGDSSSDPDEKPSGFSPSSSPAFAMQEKVTQSAFNPPPMFFLSTTLLTTHPSVVRDMESWPENPPRLIYREYGDASSDPRYHCDAEIILAPDCGLILTTPHELTQRYLPGHGPRDARLNGIQGINSPLREKIFRLMHRYELLVVLICKPDRTDVSRVANACLVREISSLAGLCDAQEGLATALLVPIPNHSLYIVLWCFGMGRLRYDLYPPEMIENITEGESEYEVALRDLGLNPFAARLILDDIRVGGFNQVTDFKLDPVPLPSHETVANASTDSRAFDMFVSMRSFFRNMEYGSLVGEDVMHRVSEVIESTVHSSSDENEDDEDVYGTQISPD
ncbi:hypothetical protein N7505_004550 [Penicillium chrysogenum]|uniref:Uncharacterized protein n=1 Tax=Penicillium chrysogenum TaxID=5076 RepID=A0ABQ8WFE9_PENCH|nr:hypothetical protein N7524_006518 [Penicillium chrysogenum]KAJ5268792.1 hypothetical protein N7505_004550 [Penicillium chrysogenum]